jgi:ABC-2 type transport system permease protein
MSGVPSAAESGLRARPPALADPVSGARAPGWMSLRFALRAEWVKIRTTSGPVWLLAALAVLTFGVSLAAIAASRCPAGTLGCPADTTKLSLTGVQVGQALAAILGALFITNEYSSRMMNITLTAMPRRSVVALAKAMVLLGTVLPAAVIGVAASMLAGRLLLPGEGYTRARGFAQVAVTRGPELRAACGAVLYLGLIALLGMGIALLIRDSAVSAGTVLGLLYLSPIIAAMLSDSVHWQHRVERYAPMSAGLAILNTKNLHSLPIGPWEGLGVLALWTAAALLAGALAFRLRDA